MKRFLYRFIPPFVLKFLRGIFPTRELTEQEWRAKGCPSPPPHVIKQATIEEYQRTYGISVLVETGTYRGDMIAAQMKRFEKIISIELGLKFYEAAKERFRENTKVVLYNGDSGVVMPRIVTGLNESALFWLDGHYMPGVTEKSDKECPIYEELDAILKNRSLKHVILIDDARLFVGKYDYPTISELTEYIKERDDRYTIEVKYDIIRITGK